MKFRTIIRAGHHRYAPPDSDLEEEGWCWLGTHRGGMKPGTEYTVWILYKPGPDIRLAARKLLKTLDGGISRQTDHWLGDTRDLRKDMAILKEALEREEQRVPDAA